MSLSDRKGVGVDGAAAPTPASTGGDTDELNMNESGGDIQDADTLGQPFCLFVCLSVCLSVCIMGSR